MNKFLVRLFLFLILIEIFLRVDGYIFLQKQAYQIKQNYRHNAYRIVCLGDSLTASGGEDSFPSQLQEILDHSNTPVKFEVINKGMPGANSNIIYGNLNKVLDEYNPNMVVITMGSNDRREPVKLEQNKNFLNKLQFIKKLKTYKLTSQLLLKTKDYLSKKNLANLTDTINSNEYIFQNQKPTPVISQFDNSKSTFLNTQLLLSLLKKAEDLYKEKKFAEAEKILQPIWDKRNQLDPVYFGSVGELLMNALQMQKKYAQLIPLWDYFYDVLPHHVTSTLMIQNFCKNNINAAMIEQFLLTKNNKIPDSITFNGLLAECYVQWGKPHIADTYFKKLKEIREGGDVLILKTNYLATATLLKKRNIKGVFVQYPTLNVDNLKRFFKSVENNHDFAFVDNEASFRESAQIDKYSDYFIDRDQHTYGHCTPKGNKIIAQNIADVILKEFFFIK